MAKPFGKVDKDRDQEKGELRMYGRDKKGKAKRKKGRKK